ncbi:fungal-specific transcription factor domain-containing protein [Mariannaea sp. PMI_226]|nr:fungal-specific transcription factor domain-containing protein [Mariannaea sp. PMI_226]
MPPEDVAYIRAKGVFSLPPLKFRDALMQSYFRHVHPFCPVLDASEFIPQYEQGRVSLLLLWSMYVAATSFIDEGLFSDESFPTRLALKRTAYQRAKASQHSLPLKRSLLNALYDADYEKDKITLIQSVFLLGFWYTGTDDRAGPWHWNGIAIALSQGMGLHRRLVFKNASSGAVQSFWRRLWWTIYCREAWLSLGHGRPMRIFLDDSDLPMPGLEDINILSAESSVDASQRYLPGELCVLFDIWLSYVKISRALGTILSANYPAKGSRVSNSDLEHSESEIRACYSLSLEGSRRSRLVAAHLYQFKLYFQAAIIVLYRPYLVELPFDLPAEATEAWRTFAGQKARAAASEAIGALNSMIAEDLVRYCHSITVLALVPPMQIHLLESTSSNPVRHQMGKHNLALCMLAMRELRKVYVSAEAIFSLFETAQDKIERRARLPETEQIVSVNAPDDEWSSVEVVATSAEGVATLAPGILSNWWAPFPNEQSYGTSTIMQ